MRYKSVRISPEQLAEIDRRQSEEPFPYIVMGVSQEEADRQVKRMRQPDGSWVVDVGEHIAVIRERDV